MAPITINPLQTPLPPPTLTDPSIIHVRDTVNQIKLVAARVLALQSSQRDLSDDEQLQLQTDQKKLTNLKIMLRGFNRDMYLQNRAVKQATSEAKAQVDNLYLTLQNLKYEQQHLRSEIQDCRNYVYVLLIVAFSDLCSTLYTDLELVSEEEFLGAHPEFVGLEGHELMLKRLEDEAEERVDLETKRKDLVNRRTATQADSKKRKNDLDNLTETLKKFIEVPILFLSYYADQFRVLRLFRRCFRSTKASPCDIDSDKGSGLEALFQEGAVCFKWIRERAQNDTQGQVYSPMICIVIDDWRYVAKRISRNLASAQLLNSSRNGKVKNRTTCQVFIGDVRLD
jgi:hypothetical protein